MSSTVLFSVAELETFANSTHLTPQQARLLRCLIGGFLKKPGVFVRNLQCMSAIAEGKIPKHVILRTVGGYERTLSLSELMTSEARPRVHAVIFADDNQLTCKILHVIVHNVRKRLQNSDIPFGIEQLNGNERDSSTGKRRGWQNGGYRLVSFEH